VKGDPDLGNGLGQTSVSVQKGEKLLAPLQVSELEKKKKRKKNQTSKMR